jgi:hypothetical protein
LFLTRIIIYKNQNFSNKLKINKSYAYGNIKIVSRYANEQMTKCVVGRIENEGTTENDCVTGKNKEI